MTYERVQTLLRSEILSINGSRQDGWRVAIAHQDAAAAALHRIDLDARAVVLATGTHIVGEDWIRATKGATDCRALIECGPAGCVDPNRWFGARPVIVGGGDNAANCAMILAARGSRPIILARSPHLRAAANYQAQLQELAASGQVDLRLGVSIRAVKLESASILRITTDSGDDILGERIFLTLGYGPNSHNILDKFTGRLPSLSASGYIQVDGDCETDIPGLYAIGDVANERHPCSATAIAMGTVAGRAIGNYNNRDEP